MATEYENSFDWITNRVDLVELEADISFRGEQYGVTAFWNRYTNEYSCYDFWSYSREIHEDFTLSNKEAEMIHKELQEQN